MALARSDLLVEPQASPAPPHEQRSSNGLLKTPGRLISGVFSWLSPWKPKERTEQAAEEADVDAEDSGDKLGDGERQGELHRCVPLVVGAAGSFRHGSFCAVLRV